MIDNFDLRQLVEPLQTWFKKNARVLPWRENPKAYYVWISEIMLQQTRVEAVKPYFDRFIKELPDVKSLAECPEDKLLKLWEGLGYYNRVRNLKVAANQILEEYDGVIPSEYEELLKLKGIGHYTAGAIASIAYGKAVPAVDGNVLRVISRVTADDSDIMKQSVRTHMEEQLLALMVGETGKHENVQSNKNVRLNENVQLNEDIQSGRNMHSNGVCGIDEVFQNEPSKVVPAVFNQALMELGATVCVPNGAPHCEACPWNDICMAKKMDIIMELPVKKKAKERRIEERTVLILKDGTQLALHKRPKKGLLAGMYELPNVEGHLSEEEVLSYVKEQGYAPLRIQKACDAKHIFSHVEWRMKGYVVFLQADEFAESGTAGRDAEDAVPKDAVIGMEDAVPKKAVMGMEDTIPKDAAIGMEDAVPKKAIVRIEDAASKETDMRIDGEVPEAADLECIKKEGIQKKQEWIFVEPIETKDRYAIPSAFVKYTEYLNLVIGKDVFS